MLVPSASPPVSGALARSRLGIPSSSSSASGAGAGGGVVVPAAAYVPQRILPLRSVFRRCPCGVYSSKTRATAELAEGRELREKAGAPRGVAVPSFPGAEKEVSQSRSFLNAQTEEGLVPPLPV